MTRSRIAALVLLPLLLAPAACKPSAYVTVTVTNASGEDIRQFELDYPGASAGKDQLPNGAIYQAKVQLRGSGTTKATFTDASGKEHSAEGPALHEGQRGLLNVKITPGDSVTWDANVK